MKLTTFKKTIFVLSILKFIFVVSLILSLLLWSIPVLAFNSSIWKIFQERSGVIVNNDAKSYNDLIIEFFRKGLKLDFLNEQEFSHMREVRAAIIIANIVFAFSFVFLISGVFYLSRTQKRFLLEATRKTSIVVFVVTLILSIIILTNFQTSFISFHKIVFVKNFIFSDDSILKTLYPDKFFYGLSAFYLISILLVSLLVAVISHRLKLK